MDSQELIAQLLVKGRGKAPSVPLPRPDPREVDEYDFPDRKLTPDEFSRMYRRAPVTDTDMMSLITEPDRLGGGRHMMFRETEPQAIPQSDSTNLTDTVNELWKLHKLGAARTIDDPYDEMPASDINQEKMYEGAKQRYQLPGTYDPDTTPEKFIASLIGS